jgi:hypothetical protein
MKVNDQSCAFQKDENVEPLGPTERLVAIHEEADIVGEEGDLVVSVC